MKKTQLGPESTQRNRLRGICYEVGDEEDAARPRVNSEERTQGELLLKWGMKKTQLGRVNSEEPTQGELL